jgi:nucleotide-binding universal stress UspA family protein
MYLDSPYAALMAQPYLADAIAAEREAAAADLDAIAAELREAGIAATTVVQAGSPANDLLDLLAGRQYDLVVMSSHGRTGVKRWMLGSVAERLVEASHTPVLIVRAAVPAASQA